MMQPGDEASTHKAERPTLEYFDGRIPSNDFLARRRQRLATVNLVGICITVILTCCLLYEAWRSVDEVAKQNQQLVVRGPFAVGFGDELAFSGTWAGFIFMCGYFLLTFIILVIVTMAWCAGRGSARMHMILFIIQFLVSIPIVVLVLLAWIGGIFPAYGVLLAVIAIAYLPVSCISVAVARRETG